MSIDNSEFLSQVNIRTMYIEDYEKVSELWHRIEGFGIRSIDDSYDGVASFLERNDKTSVVAELGNEIIGTILCGHDGRRGNLYHVCVDKRYRKNGVGKAMVAWCMTRLRAENVNTLSLVAYKTNDVGNSFWKGEDFKLRDDMNQYDFILNEENITRFNDN